MCSIIHQKKLIINKLFTLAVFAIACSTQEVSAQIKKGEKMLGGSIHAMVDKVTYASTPAEHESRSTQIGLAPQLGFGVGNNWVLGVSAGYVYGRSKLEGTFGGTVRQRSNIYNGGIFARKFHPFKDRFGIFAQADASYGFGKTKYTSDTSPKSESKTTTYEVSVRPGAYYRASRRFIIEAGFGGIGYNHMVSDPGVNGIKNTFRRFNFSLTNSLNFGVQVIL